MSNLRLISDYRHQEVNRNSFNDLAFHTFGIDFELWYQKGFWNERYICYSYADAERIIANVSVSKVELIWESTRIRAIQIGTVMTHPDYRNKGLSNVLMHIVMDKYKDECELFYLFANSSVLDYYPRFGFKAVKESLFELEVKSHSYKYAQSRRVDPSNPQDLSLICDMVINRRPLSQVCGVESAGSITMWYCLHAFKDHIHYVNELNAVVICRQEGVTLHIYDIICKIEIDFQNLIGAFMLPDTEMLRFYFTPDLLNVETIAVPADDCDKLFVRSSLPSITQHFKYPVTAQA